MHGGAQWSPAASWLRDVSLGVLRIRAAAESEPPWRSTVNTTAGARSDEAAFRTQEMSSHVQCMQPGQLSHYLNPCALAILIKLSADHQALR